MIDGISMHLPTENPLLGSKERLQEFRRWLPNLKEFAKSGEWGFWKEGLMLWAAYYVYRMMLPLFSDNIWKRLSNRRARSL